jgi:hypothetical protein
VPGRTLIVTSGAEPQLQAVMPVSGLIPIVFWANNFDPIERGYVKTLARRGGNITGVFTRQPELAEKQVELLTQTSRSGPAWECCGTRGLLISSAQPSAEPARSGAT